MLFCGNFYKNSVYSEVVESFEDLDFWFGVVDVLLCFVMEMFDLIWFKILMLIVIGF